MGTAMHILTLLLLYVAMLYFGVAINLFVKTITSPRCQHMSLWGKIRLSFGWALIWYFMRRADKRHGIHADSNLTRRSPQ